MMLRNIFLGFIGLFFSASLFSANALILVSFSMPEQLLEETLMESSQMQIPAYLNGLYQNSMEKTALKVMKLNKRVPHLNLNIDPTLFERFNVHQVPALIVENGKHFDVIYGNLTIKEGLSRMQGHGDVGLTSSDLKRIIHE